MKPMKRKSEVLLAIKQSAKEVGAPDSFVADMSGEQMSSEVKKFCNDIGTTSRVFEEHPGHTKLSYMFD